MLKIYCAPLGDLSGSNAAYALLDRAYREEYGGALPEIKKTPNGKPYFPERPDEFFSLSHAKTHVLCALSSNPVGADIESPRSISERAIRYFCTQEELSFFDPLDLWVLKESYIKLIGGRLAMVKDIRFSRDNGGIITPDGLSLSKLYRIGICHAAISAYGSDLPESIELLRSADRTDV